MGDFVGVKKRQFPDEVRSLGLKCNEFNQSPSYCGIEVDFECTKTSHVLQYTRVQITHFQA